MIKFLGELLKKIANFKAKNKDKVLASFWIFGEIEKPESLK